MREVKHRGLEASERYMPLRYGDDYNSEGLGQRVPNIIFCAFGKAVHSQRHGTLSVTAILSLKYSFLSQISYSGCRMRICSARRINLACFWTSRVLFCVLGTEFSVRL